MESVFDRIEQYEQDVSLADILKCDPKSVFTFNVPKNAIQSGGITWGNLSNINGNIHATHLYFISALIGNISRAQDFTGRSVPKLINSDNDLYLDDVSADGERIPKVLTLIEVLQGRNKVANPFVGYRFWFFVNDPKVSLAHGVKNLIQDNYQMANNVDKLSSNVKKKLTKDEECYRSYESITSIQDLTHRIWSCFSDKNVMEEEDAPEDMGMFQDESNSNVDPREEMNKKLQSRLMRLYDPLIVLKPSQQALESWVEGICDEQGDLENYFNVNDAITPQTFKGFPIRDYVYKVYPRFFNPKSLFSMPLPNWVYSQMNKYEEQAKSIENSVSAARQSLAEIKEKLLTETDEEKRKILEEEKRAKRNAIHHANQRIKQINAQSVTFLNTSITNNPGLAFGPIQGIQYLERTFARFDEFIAKRLENLATVNRIDKEYIRRFNDEKKQEEFCDVMLDTRRVLVNECWNILHSHKQNIPSIAGQASEFYDNQEQNVWHETNTLFNDPNISMFTNFMAYVVKGLDKCSRVSTNFQIVLISLLAANQSFYYEYDLRPHMLITGPKAIGKSFILDIIEALFFPGSVMTVSHSTSKASNTEPESGPNDTNEMPVLIHEASNEALGHNKMGQEMLADPELKNRLTKGYTVTDTIKMENGKRIRYKFCTRVSRVELWLSNETMKHASSPLASRFIIYPLTQKNRAESNPGDQENELKFTAIKELGEEYISFWNKLTWFSFMYSKLIETGILPPIDDTSYDVVCKAMFAELVAAGIPYPQTRKITMGRKLAISLQMLFNCYLVFNSEIGKKIRENPYNIEKFDPEVLLELGKYGFVLQEVAIFVITLLEPQWIPMFNLTVLTYIGRASGMFPTCSKTKYHLEEDDHIHYIKVKVEKDFYKTVALMMEGRRPSYPDIAAAVSNSTEEYIDSTPLVMKDEGPEKKIEMYRQMRRKKEMPELDIDNIDIDPNDIDQVRDLLEQYMSETPIELIDEIDREWAETATRNLVPAKGNQKKKIPVVKEVYEDVPGGAKGEKSKFLLISIEFLNKDFKGVMKNALKRLCHQGAQEATVLTGFTYEHETGKGTEKKKVELYQLFQTFKITQDPSNALVMANRYAWEKSDFNTLCHYSDSKLHQSNNNSQIRKYEDLPLAARAKKIVVDKDLDHMVGLNYLYMNGFKIPPIEEMTMLPRVARHKVIEIRMTDPAYKISNTKLMNTYPLDMLKEVIESLKEKKKAGIIEHICQKYRLEFSQIEYLNDLTIPQLAALGPDQIKAIPINKQITAETSQHYVPMSRLFAGQSRSGRHDISLDGAMRIPRYYEYLDKIERLPLKKIRKDLDENEQIQGDEEITNVAPVKRKYVDMNSHMDIPDGLADEDSDYGKEPKLNAHSSKKRYTRFIDED